MKKSKMVRMYGCPESVEGDKFNLYGNDICNDDNRKIMVCKGCKGMSVYEVTIKKVRGKNG